MKTHKYKVRNFAGHTILETDEVWVAIDSVRAGIGTDVVYWSDLAKDYIPHPV